MKAMTSIATGTDGVRVPASSSDLEAQEDEHGSSKPSVVGSTPAEVAPRLQLFRISRQDDWGRLSFWAGKVQLVPGTRYEIVWPTGASEVTELHPRSVYRVVHDQGRSYGVDTTELVVVVRKNGMDIDVPATRFRVWVLD